jgi:hypothetical protein
MNEQKMVSKEEEDNIRNQIRMELEHKFRQEMLKKEERATQEQEKLRLAEIERIRRDEEIEFYSERGYVVAGQTVDNKLLWKQADDHEHGPARKHRRHRHHDHSSSLNRYKREIYFVIVFSILLSMLIIYYKL